MQRTLTYFIRGNITVQLTSCLTGLDSTKQVNMLLIQHKQSSWFQTKTNRRSGIQWIRPRTKKMSVLWFVAQLTHQSNFKVWLCLKISEYFLRLKFGGISNSFTKCLKNLANSVWPDLAKFCTLVNFLKVISNFWYVAKFWTCFGNYVMLCGKFSLFQMAKYWKNIPAIWSHWPQKGFLP